MTKKKPEQIILTLHKHHDTLVEREYRLRNIKARIGDIKDAKPRQERELRLKLYRRIPVSKFPPELKALSKKLRALGPEPPRYSHSAKASTTWPFSRSISPKWEKWNDALNVIDTAIGKLIGYHFSGTTTAQRKFQQALHDAVCVSNCPFDMKKRTLFTPANFDSKHKKYRLLTAVQVKAKQKANRKRRAA